MPRSVHTLTTLAHTRSATPAHTSKGMKSWWLVTSNKATRVWRGGWAHGGIAIQGRRGEGGICKCVHVMEGGFFLCLTFAFLNSFASLFAFLKVDLKWFITCAVLEN